MKARWTALGVLAATLAVAQLAPERVGACTRVSHRTDRTDNGVGPRSPAPPAIRSATLVRQFVEGEGGGLECSCEDSPCGDSGGDKVFTFIELVYEADFPRTRLEERIGEPKYILPDNDQAPYVVGLYAHELYSFELPLLIGLATLDEEGNRSLTVTTTITASEDRGFDR